MTEHYTFDKYMEQQLQDPEFRAIWEAGEPYRIVANKLVRIRCEEDLTQGQLAKRLKIPFPIYKLMESFNYEEVPDYWFVQAADKLNIPFEMTWHLKQA